MKHLQKTWRGLSDEQTKVYHDMSDLDRARYDQQRRLLKQGLLPGQQCSCDDLPQTIDLASELLLKDNELAVSAKKHEKIIPVASMMKQETATDSVAVTMEQQNEPVLKSDQSDVNCSH